MQGWFYRKCDRLPVLEGGASRSTGLSSLTTEAADAPGERLNNSPDSENQTPVRTAKSVFMSMAEIPAHAPASSETLSHVVPQRERPFVGRPHTAGNNWAYSHRPGSGSIDVLTFQFLFQGANFYDHRR